MPDSFTSADGFEYAQTDTGWLFRPKQRTVKRMAYVHAGCVTLFVAVMLVPTAAFLVILGMMVALRTGLPPTWVNALTGVGGGLAFLLLAPLLVLCAKHIYHKSLRDNGKTMTISPNGLVMLGDKVLVEAGRAKSVAVRTERHSDIEGETSVYFYVDVILDRVSAAPVEMLIPGMGYWGECSSRKAEVVTFASVLATALGVAGPDSSGKSQ